MADSLNACHFIGRLGKDPELKPVGSTSIVEVNLAVAGRVKKNGEWTEATTWLPCKFWGRTGEILCQYTQKGSEIAVSGALRQDEWQDKQTGEKRSKLYLNVDRMQLLGGKPQADSDSRPARNQPAARRSAPESSGGGYDDDIPF